MNKGTYVVRPEPELYLNREASFDNLASARYFARSWAYKSRVPILLIDNETGRPVERYSSREEAAVVPSAPAVSLFIARG